MPSDISNRMNNFVDVWFDRGQGYDRTVLAAGGGTFYDTSNNSDFVYGQNGNDTIFLGGEWDNAVGGGGNDSIYSGTGRNIMYGDGGNDYLVAQAGGQTMLVGGAGNDTFIMQSAADDLIIGENEVGPNSGIDTVSYAGVTGAITVDLRVANVDTDTGFATGAAIGTDRIGQVENVVGGTGADIIWGNYLANDLSGNSGDDHIYADYGNDVGHGGDGADEIFGWFGADTLYGDNGNDKLFGEQDNDILSGGEGNDEGYGGVGNDSLYGYTGDDLLRGEDGNDVLYGEGDNDTLFGDLGNDIAYGGAGNDIAYGWYGADLLDGGDGDDTLRGEQDNDTLYGGAGADTISGGEGADVAYGGIGNDTIGGDEGNDLLDGDAGRDSLNGGFGNDTYVLDDISSVSGQLIYQYDTIGEVAADFGGIDTVRVGYVSVGTGLGQTRTSYTLTNWVENGVITGTQAFNLTGNSLNNDLNGNEAANVLTGGAGNDRMSAGGGHDSLIGGVGNDIYYLDSVSTVVSNGVAFSQFDDVTELAGEGVDTVYVRRSTGAFIGGTSYTLGDNVENGVVNGPGALTLTGNSLANSLLGGAGADTLNGMAGADFITGGGGADIFRGGAGNDTYYVDQDDKVDETVAGSDGVDTVQAGFSFSIGGSQVLGEIENLGLLGSADIVGYGNALDNRITGNDGANRLLGRQGDDILDGGRGGDRMEGGIGDDLYYVDSTTDIVIELANEGEDAISTTVSFNATGIAVEKLIAAGTGAVNLIGNDLENTLLGNDKANILSGGIGSDALRGNGGADRFDYNSVADSSYSDYDRIYDLTNDDVIDLSGIDANANLAGNQAFSLVAALNGQAGQISLTYNAASQFTVLAADVNGDGVADMRIVLNGDHHDFTNFAF